MPYVPDRDCVPGYLYLMESNGQYKIGFSKNPKTRKSAAKGEAWSCDKKALRLLCVVPTNHMAYAEQAMHTHFQDKRVRDKYPCEWFYLTNADVEWFCMLSRYDVDVHSIEINKIPKGARCQTCGTNKATCREGNVLMCGYCRRFPKRRAKARAGRAP